MVWARPPFVPRRLPPSFTPVRPPEAPQPEQSVDVVKFAVEASVQVASALGVDDTYEQMAIAVAEELLLIRLKDEPLS